MLMATPTSSRPPSRGDSLAEHDVELGDAERRRDLVLDDLDPDAVADRLRADLDRLDAPDVEPDAGVELEGAAAGRDLGVAEHDADLLAQLVGEDQGGVRAADDAGQLAQGLAHEAGLDADERVAHLAFDLGLGHESGDRVQDDAIHAAGPDEGLGDLERVLAGVRLADEQIVHVDAAGASVARVQGVLDVDERDYAAPLLSLSQDVLAERCLARRLGPEDLRHAAARVSRRRRGPDPGRSSPWG